MVSRWLLIVAAFCLTPGCNGKKQRDLKAEILADTQKHLEKSPALVSRLAKLTELTPATEVANSLRLFAHDVQRWRRDYMSLRAKMMVRSVSRDQQSEISRQYKAAVEELRLRVAQSERRLTKRSDTQFFYVDLQRVRDTMRDL
jgi:hypothetical protein